MPRLPNGEQPISLDVLISRVDRNPPLSRWTLLDWIKVGVKIPGEDGRRAYLFAYKDGGLWMTSVEAYHRFRADCNPQ